MIKGILVLKLGASHDYHVDISGGFPAAHYVYDFVEIEGLRFPTKRRVYFRGRASPGSAASLD